MKMKAIPIHQYGGPEDLAQVEMQRPTPGHDEVLIKVYAAAVPVAGQTALQALFEVAQLRAGQKVLIHAAAGGVGNFAVQLAKAKGAYVIGTASSKNQAFLGELGVDQAVDYQKTRFEDAVRD